MRFQLLASDGFARRGRLIAPRGEAETPAFMPVGTQATVKAMPTRLLEEIGPPIVLANAYHLFLRPGTDIIAAAGGLHRFMGWNGLILTDSGGYQIFSLKDLRKVTEEGVEFRSHIDGSKQFLTPERVMEVERAIGADFVMAFDECPGADAGHEEARAAMERTHRWAARCRDARLDGHQRLFGIVQGGMFDDLRLESAQALRRLDFPGYAIGGLSVGEQSELTYRLAGLTAQALPEDRPRYLMGVGTPPDILEAVERGVDLFDCVLPTRMARNGTAFISSGRLAVRNGRYKSDFAPLDPDCDCWVCRTFSRAYLRHLFNADEMLGPQLTTYHNLYFYDRMMRRCRSAIEEGRFGPFKREFLAKFQAGTGAMDPGDAGPDAGRSAP